MRVRDCGKGKRLFGGGAAGGPDGLGVVQLDPLAAAERPGQFGLGGLDAQPLGVRHRGDALPGEHAGQRPFLGRGHRVGSGTSPSPGPPARSSSRQRTVSAASDLLVPITPVGPRLSQPATYSPGSGAPSSPRTRPWALGTTEARVSNGTPGSGTLW